uniref:HD domain-containing phosphohydrolase n=1 Tax=Roseburia sp. TaxID=2049040 RepID=UPI003FEEC45B
MVSSLYLLTFIASVVMTGWFLLRNKKTDNLYVIFCLLVIINSLGRYLLSVSDNLWMALTANKLIYVGGCYCPLFIVLALRQLCGIRISKVITSGMTLFSTVMMGFVLTIGHSDIYYKDVQLAEGDGYHYLIKTYGPAHSAYVAMVLLYGLLIVYYLIYAIRRRSHISVRTVSVISVMGMGVVIAYLLERLLKSKVSYVSLGYLAATVCLVYLLERINIYDLTANIAISVERLGEYGYIEFDRKYRYVNANSYAKELFPAIEQEWRIDAPVPVSDSYLYREVVLWLKKTSYKGSKMIPVNGSYIQMSVRDIMRGRKHKAGYLVELIDRTSEQNYLNAIENYNSNLQKEVARKTADIVHIKDMMVLGMATMVESRDNSTGGHIRRTSRVVEIFSDRLSGCLDEFGISEEFLQMVIKAAPMHDLGKIAVPDSVLQKQGKFTAEEYEIMKRHSAEGARIVNDILKGVESEEFVRVAVNVAHYHHEKWNGQGYPTGISGEEIPIEARIMALADVFDALVSKRCYKDAYSFDTAFGIIEESLGTQFDPELGRVFLTCRKELEQFYR